MWVAGFIIFVSLFQNLHASPPRKLVGKLESKVESKVGRFKGEFRKLSNEVIDTMKDSNDVKTGECKPYTLIFVRGTWDKPGNMGIAVGPHFAHALQRVLPGGKEALAVQGVRYSAETSTYFQHGSTFGASELTKWIKKACGCSKTKLIISGYSQGAQIVHRAIDKLPQEMADRVNAIVTFGDPEQRHNFGKGLDAKAKRICYDSDLICKEIAVPVGAHWIYELKTKEAAEFVAGKV
ncbi:hypothetical protein H072_7464 [Dactylellina haptotyla CBS 200.50]|uniref:cutinase n=1 Tax=Dactylellina haptotyla (strain CBS 200.50) TaxID=1284197 RepID=S8BTZ0_DACHA|nr:hypothetical protein H072_7464 [Dactylellina haptotyla CBS 200.50]